MNYFKLLNSFNELVEKNPLPALSQIVWYKLVSLFNTYGWSEWVSVDNRRLMWVSQISNEKTFINYRNKLIDKGLIEYKKGKKGNPSQYKLIDLTVIDTVQSTVQVTVNSTVNPTVEVTDINKLKTKNKNKESNLSTPLRYVEKLPKKFASKNRLENEFENILSESDHDEFENTLPNSTYGERENAHLTNEEFKNAQFANGEFVRLGNSKDESKNAHLANGESKNVQFADEESTRPERYKYSKRENTQFTNVKSKNARLASGEFEKPEKHKHDESKNILSKSTYGEFKNVFLTSEEFAKLETEYGKELNEIIEHLSSYIEMKGYKAKSHYLAIRKWVALAYREQKLHEAELAKREENLKQHKNFNSGGNNGQNSESTRNNFNNRANNGRDSEVARRAYCTEFAHIKSTDGSTYTAEQMAEVRASIKRMLEKNKRANEY